jgi:AraC-like DNA-binding protein
MMLAMAQSVLSRDPLPRYFSALVTSARRFHLRPKYPHHEGISVIGGGVEHCRKDYLIERPGFPFTILEFVASGSGQLVMNRKTHDLIPGTVFVYGRGTPHRMRTDPEHPMIKYFLVFAGRGLAALLRSHDLAPGAVFRVVQTDRMRRIFEDVIDFGLGDRPDREACCAQTVKYLMLKLADSRVPSGQPAARAFATYERCRVYMESHALGITSLQEVASACHVDTAYMCRLFQRFGRERPYHYLQHLRMNHAMTLLQVSDRLIKEIAMELNFSDAANFTRAFRHWYGVPPQSMRR